MSLFMDGFDFYTAITQRWDAGSNANSFSNVGSGIYSYGRSIILDGNSIYKTFANITGATANWQTIYFGYNITLGITPGNDTQKGINILDGTTNQINFRITAAGIIKVYRNATLLATGTHALAANTTYWIAGKVYIHASAGVITLTITGPGYDNVTDINIVSGDAVDTMETANAYATKIGFSHFGGNNISIDNVHIYDGADAAPWDALSIERRVYYFLPTGDGSNIDFTASTGARYTCQDENPKNDDTDYINSATVGHKNSVVIDDIPTVTVDALNLIAAARRDDATAVGIKLFSKISGTDYLSDELILGSAYVHLEKQWLVSPATTAAWEEAEVNAAEWGVNISS